jgi:hypothetical protein
MCRTAFRFRNRNAGAAAVLVDELEQGCFEGRFAVRGGTTPTSVTRIKIRQLGPDSASLKADAPLSSVISGRSLDVSDTSAIHR